MSAVTKLDETLMAWWSAAAADLGIRVTAPSEVMIGHDAIMCEAFLPDFGSPDGMVVITERTERRERARLRQSGSYFTRAASKGRAEYLRKHAIDVLLDHGWFGNLGDAPDWYRSRTPS